MFVLRLACEVETHHYVGKMSSFQTLTFCEFGAVVRPRLLSGGVPGCQPGGQGNGENGGKPLKILLFLSYHNPAYVSTEIFRFGPRRAWIEEKTKACYAVG
jgi:hypothetical protein